MSTYLKIRDRDHMWIYTGDLSVVLKIPFEYGLCPELEKIMRVCLYINSAGGCSTKYMYAVYRCVLD